MGRFAVFTFPLANTTDVAALQTLAGAGSLSLNGNLSYTLPIPGSAALATVSNNYENSTPSPYIGSTVSAVKFPGVSRTVSLTSTNNLGGVNFTITGTSNGVVVAETRVGPNNNTVYTAAYFDTITSITTNGAAAAVSAGSGTTGITNWFQLDPYLDVFNLSIQVAVSSANLTYSFTTTNDDVTSVAFGSLTKFTPIAAMTGATTLQLANYTVPIRYATVNVTAAGGAGTITVTLMQQGIR